MGISLLPEKAGNLPQERLGKKTMPTYSYAVDFEHGRVRGFCDTIEAMKQMIYKCLQTQLFAQDIYDANYGFEAYGLLGKDRAFVESEIKRRVKEALIIDERILAVKNFDFNDGLEADSLAVSFCVWTVFGNVKQQTEVLLI